MVYALDPINSVIKRLCCISHLCRDPDQTLQSTASNMGLHCLLMHVCSNILGYYGSVSGIVAHCYSTH